MIVLALRLVAGAVLAQAPTDVWPGGTPTYEAVRAETAPKVDGILDDAVWSLAPPDSRFWQLESTPFGLRSTEPTLVQVAYDADALYVAFTCSYSSPDSSPDGSFPEEPDVPAAESVSVAIDGRSDGVNARLFRVTPTGTTLDAELRESTSQTNIFWRAQWRVKTHVEEHRWTAEFALPWAALGVADTAEQERQVGIDFRRSSPGQEQWSGWALGTTGVRTTLVARFGRLTGLRHIPRGKRVYLEPYVFAGYDPNASTPHPLRNLPGVSAPFQTTVGAFASARLAESLKVDLSFNPTFDTVNADQAHSNLDRFSFFQPELRPFFVEDQFVFAFGSLGDSLFYSRRIGLAPGVGTVQDLPILIGTKGIFRQTWAEVGAMAVLTDTEAFSVIRANVFPTRDSRVGAIVMHRGGPERFTAGGADASLRLLEDHLTLSGYAAGTNGTVGVGWAGSADATWESDWLLSSVVFGESAEEFDPQMGFYYATGVRRMTGLLSFTPRLTGSIFHHLELTARLNRMTLRDNTPLYVRPLARAAVYFSNFSSVTLEAYPDMEWVYEPFAIAGERLDVEAGFFQNTQFRVAAESPPGRMWSATLGYLAGKFFSGTLRFLEGTLTLRLARLTLTTAYVLYDVTLPSSGTVTGHQLSFRVGLAITAELRLSLQTEVNTFEPAVAGNALLTYRLPSGFSLALAVQHTAPGVELIRSIPGPTVSLVLAHGLMLF
jgi:hypothetical protein